MRTVLTPDGWGQVLRSESAHGKTSLLIKGAGFEGWYDSLQVTADFADDIEDVVPNEDNSTVLPYPSKPQGPGWDGTTSTIEPDIDAHLDVDGNSDSYTGEPTSESPVDADIDGLFEPASRLAGVRGRARVHFAAADDPILDVSTIPADSPTPPFSEDGVETEDLFDGSLPHFERSAYNRLVIEDDLSFLRYSADDDGDGERDDDKKEQGPSDFFGDDDDSDDGDDDDSDSDDDGDSDSDSDSDSGDGDGDSSGGDGGGDGGGGGHTAAFSLTTTADLHFLANFCNCAAEIPLHSKVEHRELVAEGKLKDRKKRGKPLGSKPLTGHYGDHDPKTPSEAGYGTPKNKGVGKTLKKNPKPRQDGGKYGRKPKRDGVERPISYAAGFDDDSAGRGEPNNVTPQEMDLDKLLERYQQDNYHFQESNLDDLVDRSEDDGDNAAILNHYARKLAAPAAQQDAQPTQIESQIEQLMQFWATDSNGWWHWTGSQADLALLNQMQQQMAAVGMPTGAPGAMQAQAAYDPAEVKDMLTGGGDYPGEGFEYEHSPEIGHVYYKTEPAGNGTEVTHRIVHNDSPHDDDSEFSYASWLHGAGQDPHSGSLMGDEGNTVVTGDLSNVLNHHADVADGLRVQGSFGVDHNTPPHWREYLQTIASNKLVALAAWKDVVQKSKRLRSEGAVDVEAFRPDVITAYIQGDHGRYYTTVQRLGSIGPGIGRQLTSTQVSGWSCECDWGHWAWIRKRSFVGRMCSHAYALFSEMRSLDAKSRRRENKGKPIGGGQSLASVSNKTSWARTQQGGFAWVSDDPAMPTAAISKSASGWTAHVWSDGTAEDSLSLGSFSHSEQARRAISRVVQAHLVTAEMGDINMVNEAEEQSADIGGGYAVDPYAEDGMSTPQMPGSTGIQESVGRYGFSMFAAGDGQDDDGPEEDSDGIEEEADPSDEESLDEEVAEDENDSSDGEEDEGEAPDTTEDDDDGGHYEAHKRDDDDDEGTDNPGDESDDEGIEKESSLSVAELQAQYGLTHLAGANYSLAQQNNLVQEGNGQTARNRGDLNLTGTHYEAAAKEPEAAEDVLAFLF